KSIGLAGRGRRQAPRGRRVRALSKRNATGTGLPNWRLMPAAPGFRPRTLRRWLGGDPERVWIARSAHSWRTDRETEVESWAGWVNSAVLDQAAEPEPPPVCPPPRGSGPSAVLQ